jgi:hypothetical protein
MAQVLRPFHDVGPIRADSGFQYLFLDAITTLSIEQHPTSDQ